MQIRKLLALLMGVGFGLCMAPRLVGAQALQLEAPYVAGVVEVAYHSKDDHSEYVSLLDKLKAGIAAGFLPSSTELFVEKHDDGTNSDRGLVLVPKDLASRLARGLNRSGITLLRGAQLEVDATTVRAEIRAGNHIWLASHSGDLRAVFRAGNLAAGTQFLGGAFGNNMLLGIENLPSLRQGLLKQLRATGANLIFRLEGAKTWQFCAGQFTKY